MIADPVVDVRTEIHKEVYKPRQVSPVIEKGKTAGDILREWFLEDISRTNLTAKEVQATLPDLGVTIQYINRVKAKLKK